MSELQKSEEEIAKLIELAHAAYHLSGGAACVVIAGPERPLTFEFLSHFRENIEQVQRLYEECGFERKGMEVADGRVEEALEETRLASERRRRKEEREVEALEWG
jgi:hypothetical protein